MSRSEDRKIALAVRVLNTNDNKLIETVEHMLGTDAPFKLTERQKAELDSDFADHKADKGRNYSWNDVKAYARARSKK
jgi:putative addiction module component (TIGR02574 family)